MKKLLKLTSLICVSMILFQSCSSSSNDANPIGNSQFSIDGQIYPLSPTNPVTEIRQNNLSLNNFVFDRSTITVTGIAGTKIGTVSFDLYYKDGLLVEGTYAIDNTLENDSDFITNLVSAQKLCSGWTSPCSVIQAGSTSELINANNPAGTVKVTNNGNSNYTIQYNGNFKKYNTNFVEIGTVPIVIDITSNVFIQ
jgi:hypothetical protein